MEALSRESRGALFEKVMPWLTRTCSSNDSPKIANKTANKACVKCHHGSSDLVPCVNLSVKRGAVRGPMGDSMESRLIPAGGQAPDFTAQTLDGETITLSQFKGKSNVVLLEWATWCETCAVEIPEISGYVADLAGKGVTVLAVNFMEKPETVKPFVDEHKLAMKIVMDTDRKIARSFRMTFIPVVVIIDRDGVVRHIGKGVPASELLELLKPLTEGQELIGH